MSDISFVFIRDKKQLFSYFDSICDLFLHCFNRPLSESLWRWAYMDNPCGEPLVSIAVIDRRVVGHYAVIPQNIFNGSVRLDGYLSMTTMVHSDFRRLSLFQKLAEMIYQHIDGLDKRCIVYGFPNKNSLPGFRKRLGWEIINHSVFSFVNSGSASTVYSTLKVDDNTYKLDMFNPDFVQWRCNKPEQLWFIKDGLGLKSFNGSMDLMFFDSIERLDNLPVGAEINILLPDECSTEKDFLNKICEYPFGYRTFNLDKEPKFLAQMCMSDVF